MSEKVLDIRLRLNGQIKGRFLEIKTAKGLTNNTEALRLIINEYFEKKPLAPSDRLFFTASLIRLRPVSTRCIPSLRGLMVKSLYSGLHSKKRGICAEDITT
jgi:hypothetical protein